MSSHIINRTLAGPQDSKPVLTETETTSIRGIGERQDDDGRAHRTPNPSNSWNEAAKLEVNIDGHPIASMRVLIKPADVSSSLTFANEKTTLRVEPVAEAPASQKGTELRVGPLQLDLIDRVAARGGRRFDLGPREFRLLKYMMQRADKLLTRAALLQDVWHYKFVPKKTNLVDVYMGRLRRKVDWPNERPMIRTLRRAGFVLSSAQQQ